MGDQPDYTRMIVISGDVAENLLLQRSSSIETSQVEIGTSASVLAAANANRKILGLLYIGSQQLYVGPDGVTVATGARLPANSLIYISGFVGALYGVSNAAAQTVYVYEFT